MNNLKLKNFVFVVIFSIFFYVTQNIFLPLQKFYINLELTSLDIFLELIKFIILNLFLFKINNKNIKHFFIFLSFFIYYPGTNFLMAYFAFYIQNSVDKIRNREIIEIIKILLTQFFYYCYIYYIQNLTNNNNVEVYGLFLIMKLLILVIVFLYFLTNENFSILFSNIIENKMINLLFVGIVVNRSLNFTPIFSIDVEKIWLYNTNPIISSVLTIYIISIFYFLDLSIFSNKIKIYFYLAIKVFSNIIINDSSVFLGIEIPKELILYTYLFTFIYGVFLIINSNKNGKVEIIYKYKLVILAIYIFNSILFVGVYKYDVYNFKNIFFDITSILIMLMYFQV